MLQKTDFIAFSVFEKSNVTMLTDRHLVLQYGSTCSSNTPQGSGQIIPTMKATGGKL
jgi:hypothetical protein